jgi:hypothetical protein
MSYSAIISDINPYFYFPMSARDQQGLPLDLSNNSEANIDGFFEYKKLDNIFGPFLFLASGGPLSFSNLGAGLETSTLSFWTRIGKNFQEIINIGGLELQSSYSDGVFSIVANSQVVVQFQEEQSVFISIVFDEIIVFGSLSRVGFLYVNGEMVYSFPAQVFNEIVFQGENEIFVAEIFFVKQPLTPQLILSLFNIGSTGSDIVRVNTGSEISFSGSFKSQFQTVWQAYGIITTKR